jgi:effector-binding domain-containing protein
MSKLKRLITECKNRNFHISISYQRINDISIEIYTGNRKNYVCRFYTDGHISLKKALKKALKWIDNN